MGGRKIVISCEHAGKYVPKDYKFIFYGHESILDTHRGWDPGALRVAKYLGRQLDVSIYYQKISRLLLETNRSLHSKELFSEYTNVLSHSIKRYLVEKYYKPYRQNIEDKIRYEIEQGNDVLHLSVHTFTPILNGITRSVDIGILFDDERLSEMEFSNLLKKRLDEAWAGQYVTMMNVPYHGASDGFTTYLRTKFPMDKYVGIELEINQKYIDLPDLRMIKDGLICGLRDTVYTTPI